MYILQCHVQIFENCYLRENSPRIKCNFQSNVIELIVILKNIYVLGEV